MTVSMYKISVPIFAQFLTSLSAMLDKAAAHCEAKKIEPAALLTARLFPDMFPLERQVRQVCTHSLGAGRVAGVTLPTLPDKDNSFAEMYARIDKVVDFLKGLSPSQFDGKDDTTVTAPVGGNPREFKCGNYLYHFAMLQVQFHATTAYDLIRSTGVAIGKRDYLGQQPS